MLDRDELLRKSEEIQKAKETREIAEKQTQELQKKDESLKQLSFWEQDERHTAPNIVSRSPLFTPLSNTRDSDRKVLDSSDIFICWGVRMAVSGKQLDESDKDVFMELVRIGKSAATEHVLFSRRKLLLTIGKSANGRDYTWLEESMRRLTEATFTYFPDESNESAMKINLIQSVGWQGDKMYVRVGEEMKILFANNQYAYIDMGLRVKLRSQLSKWLYDFVKANVGSKTFKVKKIQVTCGKEGSRPNVFRKSLQKASEELAKVDSTFTHPRIYKNEKDNLGTWMFSYHKASAGNPKAVK